jgi:plastocyanin domain-containing protein
MTQQSAKRIPQWLTIDSLVIVVGLAIIGIVIWIAP